MKLIDTSLWVHALRRKGDEIKRQAVARLLESGQAAWCPVIRLELWNGVGSEKERKVLQEFATIVPDYSLTDEIWEKACDLAGLCRQAGKTVPATDVLIAACARHYHLEIAHADSHFDFLAVL